VFLPGLGMLLLFIGGRRPFVFTGAEVAFAMKASVWRSASFFGLPVSPQGMDGFFGGAFFFFSDPYRFVLSRFPLVAIA